MLAESGMRATSTSNAPGTQSLRTRGWIVVCFYLTVLASLPFWLRTTTIERLSLPRANVEAWEAQLPCPVRFRHTLSLQLPASVPLLRENYGDVEREIAAGLKAASDGVWTPIPAPASEEEGQDALSPEQHEQQQQKQSDREAERQAQTAPAKPREHAACIDWEIHIGGQRGSTGNSLGYVIDFTGQEAGREYKSTSTTRHIPAHLAHSVESKRPQEVAHFLAAHLARIFHLPYRPLFFPASIPTIGSRPQKRGDSPPGEVLDEIDRTQTDKRQIPYTKNVRLVFSLVNENSAAGPVPKSSTEPSNQRAGLAGVAGWDARELNNVFARRIGPLVETLRGPHSFTTEVQTIWFAPLQFDTKVFREVLRSDSDAAEAEGASRKSSSDNGEEAGEAALGDNEDNPEQGQAPPGDSKMRDVHLIGWDDLQVFVNAGEWGLATSGAAAAKESTNVTTTNDDGFDAILAENERTLHFVLYVPQPAHRPLRIAGDAGATSISPAMGWLVPQWGGVALFNLGHDDLEQSANDSPRHARSHMLASLSASELDSAFATFEKQLRTLLGAPNMPLLDSSQVTATAIPASAQAAITVDSLLRKRILEVSRESVQTLGSIVRLVDKIKVLGVGSAVRDDVRSSLARLRRAQALMTPRASSDDGSQAEDGDVSAAAADRMCFREGALSPSTAPLSPLNTLLDLSHTSALLSSRAFFNPHMLGQLYFPDEHKYAVYTPLFGPLAVPLLVAGLRLLRERRADKTRRGEAAGASALASSMASKGA